LFRNRDVNWYLFLLKILIIFNSVGILLSILEKEEITFLKIILYSCLAFITVIIIYLTHIKSIEYINNDLVINYNFKKYRDKIFNFSVQEIRKRRGINIKYTRLLLVNSNFKKKFKFDSNDWQEYKELKNFLIEKNMMELKNE
jgi:hypothetical protein